MVAPMDAIVINTNWWFQQNHLTIRKNILNVFVENTRKPKRSLQCFKHSYQTVVPVIVMKVRNTAKKSSFLNKKEHLEYSNKIETEPDYLMMLVV